MRSRIWKIKTFCLLPEVVENMQKHGQEFGNMSKIWMGNHLFVYVDDPSHIEAILNSPICINKGASYRFIQNFVGMGLITMRGRILQQMCLIYLPILHICFYSIRR